MKKTWVVLAGCAAVIGVGIWAWHYAGWTSVPTIMRVVGPAGCSGAHMEKLGKFEMQWETDGRLKIEAWVGHTGGEKPDASSAKSSWRGSQLKLAYSTVQPVQNKCVDVLKLEFQISQLPKKDYQVVWGDWTSRIVVGPGR